MVQDVKSGKLNGIGGYSYTVVLPKAWIRLHSLRPKDEVAFRIDDGNNLVVRPAKNG